MPDMPAPIFPPMPEKKEPIAPKEPIAKKGPPRREFSFLAQSGLKDAEKLGKLFDILGTAGELYHDKVRLYPRGQLRETAQLVGDAGIAFDNKDYKKAADCFTQISLILKFGHGTANKFIRKEFIDACNNSRIGRIVKDLDELRPADINKYEEMAAQAAQMCMDKLIEKNLNEKKGADRIR